MLKTKKGKLHLVIHGFALLHAISAWVLMSVGWSDQELLTAMTIAMLIIITQMYKYPVDMSAAVILLCIFAGFYLGTHGADLIRAIVPNPQYAANIITTFCVTELLGWATFVVVRGGERGKNRDNDKREFKEER